MNVVVLIAMTLHSSAHSQHRALSVWDAEFFILS